MNIHFIAIGGAIMHNLAICLKHKGHTVKGSDDIIFDPAKKNLKDEGLLPSEEGFFENNITEDIDAIILGMHAKKDNVELKKAQELGIPIYSFPEFIYEESKDKIRVSIAGSHGKTSTTAMIMHVLQKRNMEFDYLVGAALEGFDRSVALSDAPIIILEGDEYLSSPIEMKSKFHFYKPHITMITGIAWDHVNVFPTLDLYHKTFEDYVENLVDDASLIYFEGDEVLKYICTKATCKKLAYHTPDYNIEDGITSVTYQGKEYVLAVFGKHNLQNMEGARLVCEALNISGEHFFEAIADFGGAARRLQKIDTSSGVVAYNDFAHSPSKLKATLEAVAEQYQGKEIIAVMELHTFSSTDPAFLSEFEGSMDPASSAYVYMSERAFSIKNKSAISDKQIHDSFKNHDIKVFRTPEDLKKEMIAQNKKDSVFLLMSSGNFDGIQWKEVL